jgi:tRNA pseudouridine55 synthase
MTTDGIILIDKPIGWTSHDVVAKVRNILKKEAGQKIKVGHTGTLDPLATGLLVLVVGSYTKRAAEFSKLDKTYHVVMKLGENSSTGDSEGELTKISNKKPSEEEITEFLDSFQGDIQQIPPAYSAIKVDGQRAYKLARAGKQVDLEPRKVTIQKIELINYQYPEVKFIAYVSSGTYIRSLVEDIGKELDTGAYMNGLKRTNVGQFDVHQAVIPEELNIDKIVKY